MVNDGEALDTYIEQSEMQLLDTRATEIDNAHFIPSRIPLLFHLYRVEHSLIYDTGGTAFVPLFASSSLSHMHIL